MNTSPQSNNSLVVKLLKLLGNRKPTQKQVQLIEQLLLKTDVKQRISFDPKLSEQEVSCLFLAAKGFTSITTAELLSIDKTTVETYRRRIMQKLSCSTLTQAVYEGMRFGYIRPKTD